ncbi:MAG: RNA pseudouridine synthase [Clostridia bacterium]
MGGMMEILYEDNHVIVVVKPINMPVVADSSGDEDLQGALKDYLKKKHGKPGNVFLGIVHRLDRPVGGVMVFARTSKAASRLSEQIRERKMEKTYLAVVKGIPKAKKAELKDYLVKDGQTNTSRVTREHTKEAKLCMLDYEVMKSANGHSLLKVILQTGRHHQIRVQLSNLGHPIFGDVKYSGEKEKTPIALWAWKLAFFHPVGKEEMCFQKDPDYRALPYSFFK